MKWERWFAWFPVQTPAGWIWLRPVMRRKGEKVLISHEPLHSVRPWEYSAQLLIQESE